MKLHFCSSFPPSYYQRNAEKNYVYTPGATSKYFCWNFKLFYLFGYPFSFFSIFFPHTFLTLPPYQFCSFIQLFSYSWGFFAVIDDAERREKTLRFRISNQKTISLKLGVTLSIPRGYEPFELHLETKATSQPSLC